MKRSKNKQIWTETDYAGRKISLYVNERDHIYEGHTEMRDNFHAIAETIRDPDAVYTSASSPTREVFFGSCASASYSQKGFATKAIVEFDCDKTYEDGYIVTAFAKKKEGGNVGNVLYKKSDVRQQE